MAVVARWRDYRGRLIELTEAGLAHITSRHPALSEPVRQIGLVLAEPKRVTRDARISRAECYYLAGGGRAMVKVVVLFRPTPDGWVGEVLTAHPTERYRNVEVQLWP